MERVALQRGPPRFRTFRKRGGPANGNRPKTAAAIGPLRQGHAGQRKRRRRRAAAARTTKASTTKAHGKAASAPALSPVMARPEAREPPVVPGSPPSGPQAGPLLTGARLRVHRAPGLERLAEVEGSRARFVQEPTLERIARAHGIGRLRGRASEGHRRPRHGRAAQERGRSPCRCRTSAARYVEKRSGQHAHDAVLAGDGSRACSTSTPPPCTWAGAARSFPG